MEEAWSDLMPNAEYCQFDAERTFRMSALERAQLQAIRIASGVSTVDEERATEGRAPLPTITKELPA